MKVIPFILKEGSVPKLKVYKISLFLANGGQSVWELDDTFEKKSDIEEYLELNGLFVEKMIVKEDCTYCKIDTKKTKLSDFYLWEEVNEDPAKRLFECWRNYYYFYDSSYAAWWCGKDLYLAEINGLGNISTIIEEIGGLRDL